MIGAKGLKFHCFFLWAGLVVFSGLLFGGEKADGGFWPRFRGADGSDIVRAFMRAFGPYPLPRGGG